MTTKSTTGLLLGTLAAGALLCAAPAQAAQGALYINGHAYAKTTNCLTVRSFPLRLRIVNNSDEQARVYLLPGCHGGVTKSVEAGAKAAPIGSSVLEG